MQSLLSLPAPEESHFSSELIFKLKKKKKVLSHLLSLCFCCSSGESSQKSLPKPPATTADRDKAHFQDKAKGSQRYPEVMTCCIGN